MNARRIALPAVALTLVLAAPAAAQDTPRIAPGVTAGGVDVGGLTVAEASAKLTQALAPILDKPVVLGVAGVPWRLTAAEAKFRFDADKTARDALAVPAPAPGTTAPDVPPVVSHSRLAVKAFVAKVAAKVSRPARNATIRITLRHLAVRRARHGRGLGTTATAKLVDAALDAPGVSRVLHARLRTTSPKVNANDIRRQYRTVLTVDKVHFRLRLFKDLKFRKSYPVAVGQPAYPTPSGLFRIQDKQVNPVWSVPNSPWAGELGGTTVEGGSAANPLKARWMGIANGVGIHGTGEDYSIGHAASHGCIRMHVSDVIDLFPRVPVGTPVLIR